MFEWTHSQWLGVRVWIWLYLILSILLGIMVVVYWFREAIRREYYQFRFPEKLLKVVIHYKNNYFKDFWRLIPDNNEFILEGKAYQYSDKKVLKDNDFYLRKVKDKIKVVIDNKEYDINDKLKLLKKWRKYAEIHYYHNCPVPIDFDMSKKLLDFSSKQLQDFKDNDLFAKLLTLDTEKNMLMFILILGIINTIASVLMFAKMMGWIE